MHKQVHHTIMQNFVHLASVDFLLLSKQIVKCIQIKLYGLYLLINAKQYPTFKALNFFQ